jgi:hypothetical protein
VVDLVGAQRQEAANDRGRLLVRSDEPGMVYAEGVRLGASDGELEAAVAPGKYRIWLETSTGWSLPHAVVVEAEPTEVRIDMALDRRLEPGIPVVLDCGDPCPSLMQKLAQRLSVDGIVGVRSSPALPPGQLEAVSFDAADGSVEAGVLDSASGLVQPLRRFRLTALVPFGVGQITERRYALGGGYLAAQAALLGWHLYARHQFNVAARGADLAQEERRRRETNLSLGLLLGAMSANVIEAVIVGYLWPALEQP